MDDLVTTSKFLSLILRHKPESIGLTLDNEGWVEVDLLLTQANQHGYILDSALLHRIIAESEKKRFTISSDGKKIRAAQGHSLRKVDLQYPPQEPPHILYHGTAQRFLVSIHHQGIVAGERQYVHLTEDIQTALEVGKRYGSPALLQIDAWRMHLARHVFYQAGNGVWLTGSVPVHFINVFDGVRNDL